MIDRCLKSVYTGLECATNAGQRCTPTIISRVWAIVMINVGLAEAHPNARVCKIYIKCSTDAVALNNSHYGRPNLVMHYVYMVCGGDEDKLTQCAKSVLSLSLGKTRFRNASAAGVSCNAAFTKLPCLASLTPKHSSLRCGPNGSIRLSGGLTSNEGRLEYCYNGNWSPFCTLRPQEATVACKQLGYTRSTRKYISMCTKNLILSSFLL